MNSGSPGGICTLPLLCEKNWGEPPPSAYAPVMYLKPEYVLMEGERLGMT